MKRLSAKAEISGCFTFCFFVQVTCGVCWTRCSARVGFAGRVAVHVWGLLDVLRDASTHPEYNFNLNRILADKMLKYLLALNNICIDRIGVMHERIQPMK